MRITKVIIKGIKSHKETFFHPEEYTIFVGENNTGKSNIFFAMRWFFKDVKLSFKDVFSGFQNNPEVQITFKLDSKEEFPAKIDKDYINPDNEFTVQAYAVLAEVKKKDVSPKYQLVAKNKEPKSLGSFKLGEIIFVPSIRELNDELKFTANSSINKLVSRFVIERIRQEGGKESRFSQVKNSIEELSRYISTGESSAFESLKRILRKNMLEYKDISIDFRLEPPSLADFIKSSLRPEIRTEKGRLELNSQGMGFQRSLIFSLICGVSEIEGDKKDFVLYLIEEPELYLHPNHQTIFRNHLIKLANGSGSQVMITTHSTYFVNNLKNYSELKRIGIKDQVSFLSEITNEEVEKICLENGRLMAEAKNEARESDRKWNEEELEGEAERIAREDELRYLLWVNPERANAFLSKKVILVEGPTEKALIFYIKNEEMKTDNTLSEVGVIDTVGKYHMFKFSQLLKKLGIKIWIIFDDDEDKNINGISHRELNSIIERLKEDRVIEDYLKIPKNIESALGLENGSKGNKDVVLYHNLKSNKNACRSKDIYKTIKEFIQKVSEAQK